MEHSDSQQTNKLAFIINKFPVKHGNHPQKYGISYQENQERNEILFPEPIGMEFPSSLRPGTFLASEMGMLDSLIWAMRVLRQFDSILVEFSDKYFISRHLVWIPLHFQN